MPSSFQEQYLRFVRDGPGHIVWSEQVGHVLERVGGRRFPGRRCADLALVQAGDQIVWGDISVEGQSLDQASTRTHQLAHCGREHRPRDLTAVDLVRDRQPLVDYPGLQGLLK